MLSLLCAFAGRVKKIRPRRSRSPGRSQKEADERLVRRLVGFKYISHGDVSALKRRVLAHGFLAQK